MEKEQNQAFSDDSQENAVRYCLPDIGRLRKELPLQRELYQKGTPVQMEKAFAGGVCFNQQIQQQIILEDNLAVMDVFADYWDLIPDMRKLMVRRGSLDMNELYLTRRSLGKQCLELVKNTRFTPEFLRRNQAYLTKRSTQALPAGSENNVLS